MNATTTTRPAHENKSALDVKDGDIIYNCGYRCRVSEVAEHTILNGEPTARYTLHSEPNEFYPRRLTGSFEGGRYGGNKWAGVTIEIQNATTPKKNLIIANGDHVNDAAGAVFMHRMEIDTATEHYLVSWRGITNIKYEEKFDACEDGNAWELFERLTKPLSRFIDKKNLAAFNGPVA